MKNKDTKVTTFTERNTMLNLMPLLARTAILCAVPKIIDVTYDAFFKTKQPEAKKEIPESRPAPVLIKSESSLFNPPGVASEIPLDIKQKLGISDKNDKQVSRARLPGSRIRTKKHDTTKFTRFHYDHIIFRRRQMLQYNHNKKMNKRLNVPQLNKLLNHEFGISKSATSYSNIYCGIVSRDDLPQATGAELINPMRSGGESDDSLKKLYNEVGKL